MMSSAICGSGNVCARRFLLRATGNVHVHIHVDLAPAHAADFGTALSRQNQQLDDATDVVVTTGAPDRDKLGIGKHPLARLRAVGGERADHGVDLAQAMPERPGVHRTERGARVCGTGTAVFRGDLGDTRSHIAARDLIDRHAV
jgi:hypothetical protein